MFTPGTDPEDKGEPVLNESAYQLIVFPAVAVAFMLAVSVPHLAAFTTVVTGVGNANTFANAVTLDEIHPVTGL